MAAITICSDFGAQELENLKIKNKENLSGRHSSRMEETEESISELENKIG